MIRKEIGDMHDGQRGKNDWSGENKFSKLGMVRGAAKRCRLSLLTNSALVLRVQMRGEGGVAGSQPK